MITETEAGYLAGFIDGEGCFTTCQDPRRKGTYILQCVVVNTHVPTIDYVCSLFDRLSIKYSRHIKSSKFKPLHRTVICSYGSLIKICKVLLPYSVTKKEQIITFMKMFDDDSTNFYENLARLRELNGTEGRHRENKDSIRLVVPPIGRISGKQTYDILNK